MNSFKLRFKSGLLEEGHMAGPTSVQVWTQMLCTLGHFVFPCFVHFPAFKLRTSTLGVDIPFLGVIKAYVKFRI